MAKVTKQAKAGEIVVEFDDGHNSRIEFPPLISWFRGRWSPAGLVAASTSKGSTLCQLDMPGQCIALNVAEKRARVFDPLSEPEHQAVLEQYDGITRTKDALHRGSQALPDQEYPDLSSDQIASWWYWLNQMVRVRKTGKLVAGTFGKQPPGDPRLDYYSIHPHSPKTVSDMEKWRAGKWRPGRDDED